MYTKIYPARMGRCGVQAKLLSTMRVVIQGEIDKVEEISEDTLIDSPNNTIYMSIYRKAVVVILGAFICSTGAAKPLALEVKSANAIANPCHSKWSNDCSDRLGDAFVGNTRVSKRTTDNRCKSSVIITD